MSTALSLRISRRRANEFAQLLDGGPATNDPRLAPLVDLAAALRTVPLGPAPDFRAALRQRLVAVAAVQGVGSVVLPAPVRAPAPGPGLSALPERINEWAEGWRVRRRFITATAAVSAVVILGGVGLAGTRSLPGQPLYGIKKGTEALQLALAGSTEAKGERHLQFARTRLHEVAAIVGSPEAIGVPRRGHSAALAGAASFPTGVSSRVVSTLRTMDAETRAGTTDLTTVFARTHDAHPLRVLSSFATDQTAQLTAVLPALPAAAAAQAAQSLALIQRVGSRASDLMATPSCSATCALATPTGPTGATPTTPGGGDDLGTTPCSCAQSAPPSGSTTSSGPTPAPSPSATPEPAPQPGSPTSPAPAPSPTSPSLQDQIGGIVSNLPLPVSPPPLPGPDLPPLPVPVPTIHLPH